MLFRSYQYLQKGRSVLVEGRIKFDTWEDQNGGSRSKHSIVADRVVFLSSAGEAQDQDATVPARVASDNNSGQKALGMPEPTSEQEKELFDQIDAIKKKNDAKKASAKQEAPMGGEIEFKDQPPFEDELPF